MSATMTDLQLGVEVALRLQMRRHEMAAAFLCVKETHVELARAMEKHTPTAAEFRAERRHWTRATIAQHMAMAWSMLAQGKMELARGDDLTARHCRLQALHEYRQARRLAKGLKA